MRRLDLQGWRVALAGLLGAGALLAQAQPAPAPPNAGAIQRLDQERLQRFLRERELQRPAPGQPRIDAPAPPPPRTGSSAQTLAVRRVDVGPSAILSPEELRGAVAGLEGRRVSLKEVFDAVAAIDRLYAAKRYPTARAFVPAQDLAGGVLRIQLVEARVGRIEVTPDAGVDPAFVRARVAQQPGDLVSVASLERDLVRFNRLHDDKLRARVKPGQRFATSDLAIEVVPAPRTQFAAFADNAGRESVGRARLGAVGVVRNLAGRSDTLQFAATVSEGSRAGSISYSLPIARNDLRLDLSASRGHIRVIDGPFAAPGLNVRGRSDDLTAGLTLPFAVDVQSLWNAYARLSSRESISEIGGVQQSNLDLAVVTLGTSGEAQGASARWFVDQNLSFGLNDLGGEQHFTVWRANGTLLLQPAPRVQWVLRAGLQASPTELLPASEQFQLGGVNSVRGYPEGLLSGRNGYFASAELRYRLPLDGGAPPVSALAFVDHGGAFPFRPAGEDQTTGRDLLSGAGVGLMVELGTRATARLALGYPLRTNPADPSPQRPVVHAAVAVFW